LAVQCQSNLRQVGQAVAMYSNAHQGVIMPTIVYGFDAADGTTVRDDAWPILLVTQKYLPLPNPTIEPVNGPANPRTVLVCPVTKDLLRFSNIPGLTNFAGQEDGYERRRSYHLEPGLIVDWSYGINGATHSVTAVPPEDNVNHTYYPSTSIGNFPPSVAKYPQPKKLSRMKRSAEKVLLFDGVAYNIFGSPARIVSRHGKRDPRKPTTTGVTNLLFFDGHVEGRDRIDLPQNAAQYTNAPDGRPLWRYGQ
jgi:prepilin-type processing-associated H-X9-DG protein